MKKMLLVVFFLIIVTQILFASGKKDIEEETILNNTWVLCITAFDFSHLPPSQHITGNIFSRDLVSRLNTISYRFRISPEYTYYESYAWQQSIKTIARQISQRQIERSNLLFEGLTDRNYHTRLRTIDTALESLNEELEIIQANPPLIDREPTFELSQVNIHGTFPEPPQPGTEFRFLQNQRADGFLTGEIREFHGRFFIRLRLFTLYTNSYVYEDDIIFSLDDSGQAIDEISLQLITVISGTMPAAIAIHTEQEEAQILINSNFAGRGTVETTERPPGNVTVAVAADGFDPMFIETQLSPGVLTEVSVSLGEILYNDVNVSLLSENDANIYLGALYMGNAPYSLRLPINQLTYFAIETTDGKEATAVITAPDYFDPTFNLVLDPRTPPPQGVQRVNRARRRSYWAWGSIWIAGLTAWITQGMYNSHVAVLDQTYDEDFWAKTQTLNYIRWGAIGLTGLAAINYFAIQMPRYLHASNQGATPIVR